MFRAKDAEENTVLRVAQAMAAAVRTAPKTRGLDYLDTLILTGDELETLAAKMEEIGNRSNAASFIRDAGNVRKSSAVVLVASSRNYRGLNENCQYCNCKNCAECEEKNGACVYDPMDLGIALGSAVSLASDFHIDNRIMFSCGKAAEELKLFDEEFSLIMGIPLSVSGKSIFFDRK